MDKEVTLKLKIPQDVLDILTYIAKQGKFTKEEIAKMFISKQIEDMVNWLECDTVKSTPDWVESNTKKEIQ